MKKAFIIGIICILTGRMVSYSQVAVNSDGLSADSSAMLDIRSTDKGFLVPRLTKAERLAVNSPTPGLIVFQTDTIIGFYFYTSDGWQLLDKPCGEPVEYGGGNYHTIQIGSQCWFRENLDIGAQIPLNQAQTNNQQIEKYCRNCDKYGGLYQWGEAMNYSSTSGSQVICPAGWHIPTDNDWSTLEGNLDGLYDAESFVWLQNGFRGFNAGRNMKSRNIWLIDNYPNYPPYIEQGADKYGFEVQPGSHSGVSWPGNDTSAYFWTSDYTYANQYAYARVLYISSDQSIRSEKELNNGFSIRCMRNCPDELIQSNAGPSQLNIPDTVTTLQANDPLPCVGHWSIYSGSGGNIADPSDPESIFTGMEGNSYTLQWIISNMCSVSMDGVEISFACPTANAGLDQLNLTTLTTTLQGNTPDVGTGHWSILSGTGGAVADTLNPVSAFTGVEGKSYLLEWAVYSQCPTVRDSVAISIACPTAEAGPNQVDVPGTSTTLQGNTPFAGSGLWTISSGQGGQIVSPTDPNSTFTGLPGITGYSLYWTVTSTNCATVFDWVHINFNCGQPPTTANAGPDQLNLPGVTTTLAGNTPVYGTGTWSIISGTNGIIAELHNPTSAFTGTNGTSYNLQWMIGNACGPSVDYVTISFAAFACNNTFQDIRDGKVYTTVQIGTQCWMKKNLNYTAGTGECGCNPPNCDLYGRQYDWNTAYTACPTSWHLPTDAQFCTLAYFLDPTVSCSSSNGVGTDAGGKMKETGTTYWQTPNTGATNSSGFSGRGAGNQGGYDLLREFFWTSTSNGSSMYGWELHYDDAKIYHMSYGTASSISVRCLKN